MDSQDLNLHYISLIYVRFQIYINFEVDFRDVIGPASIYFLLTDLAYVRGEWYGPFINLIW